MPWWSWWHTVSDMSTVLCSRVVVGGSVVAMFEILQKTKARFFGIIGLGVTYFL